MDTITNIVTPLLLDAEAAATLTTFGSESVLSDRE